MEEPLFYVVDVCLTPEIVRLGKCLGTAPLVEKEEALGWIAEIRTAIEILAETPEEVIRQKYAEHLEFLKNE